MPLNMRFRFSPTKDGLVKVLGPLETDIMQIIWQDERSTVKKVHRKLSQQREIAYTTVMTTMSRLAEKGVLRRHREGLAYVYTPAISESDFVTMVVQQVLDGLLDDYSTTAVDYMIDYLARRNPNELRRIQKTIQARIAA
ncbi:MAG: BlaI/MecI/CopY family transcriptional regulator [Roseiflexus sp.]|jgi:predicted transcriptional regulator|uniref:BlaI/MecI/CopY family transcriptional regulator n=1 Tax=unclassified Roseiflexus TaxID=2609473 RepID=UPI0000D81F97|nr:MULTISPECIES: BlaI/MecI/CopY family transcriptional regulator [unclassified Roseiflexus]ABQ88956.1 transcriptional repressor, CopY family [Roseiflexus sp. RS-1]MBO9323152.1 BlaI/MecI/CopY family transcriptional regulator [Roseiflexus sp.]MBO9334068.1 BlaI/MecI/CopY family transcriptional regulator [Roseiflexus sp.]MBO9343755.1 BlaI/MecI/CopY family transcriptional regulator [Roseiflexus sp.]MBO9364575.1 BlaI/MecI/CopY family transcriptional regulator [Roseiflexus sp.]